MGVDQRQYWKAKGSLLPFEYKELILNFNFKMDFGMENDILTSFSGVLKASTQVKTKNRPEQREVDFNGGSHVYQKYIIMDEEILNDIISYFTEPSCYTLNKILKLEVDFEKRILSVIGARQNSKKKLEEIVKFCNNIDVYCDQAKKYKDFGTVVYEINVRQYPYNMINLNVFV